MFPVSHCLEVHMYIYSYTMAANNTRFEWILGDFGFSHLGPNPFGSFRGYVYLAMTVTTHHDPDEF